MVLAWLGKYLLKHIGNISYVLGRCHSHCGVGLSFYFLLFMQNRAPLNERSEK